MRSKWTILKFKVYTSFHWKMYFLRKEGFKKYI